MSSKLSCNQIIISSTLSIAFFGATRYYYYFLPWVWKGQEYSDRCFDLSKASAVFPTIVPVPPGRMPYGEKENWGLSIIMKIVLASWTPHKSLREVQGFMVHPWWTQLYNMG